MEISNGFDYSISKPPKSSIKQGLSSESVLTCLDFDCGSVYLFLYEDEYLVFEIE